MGGILQGKPKELCACVGSVKLKGHPRTSLVKQKRCKSVGKHGTSIAHSRFD